jgi:transposase, IS30 family
MTYTHLTQDERYQIHILKKAGHGQHDIAALMNRHPSTISRELSRNSGQRGYRTRQAQRLSEERAANSRNARRIPPAVWEQAQARLRLQHSPEQVSAKLPVSHETLYQRIYADKRTGGDLWRHLRCQKQRRKRYASGQQRRGRIPQRRPLAERPAAVNGRRRVGHWEGDTVIGAMPPATTPLRRSRSTSKSSTTGSADRSAWVTSRPLPLPASSMNRNSRLSPLVSTIDDRPHEVFMQSFNRVALRD